MLESQAMGIPLLKTWMKPRDQYVEITLHDNLVLTTNESRAFLQGIGIAGTIVSTPGHSDDSITLVLDEGAAFTGDLPLPLDGAEDFDMVSRSWRLIREHNVRLIYPGHGPIRPLPVVIE
jgi:endoribonuclease LACTB2